MTQKRREAVYTPPLPINPIFPPRVCERRFGEPSFRKVRSALLAGALYALPALRAQQSARLGGLSKAPLGPSYLPFN